MNNFVWDKGTQRSSNMCFKVMPILFGIAALAIVVKSEVYGHTSPSGTIIKHVNDTLEITCNLTDLKFNSSQLFFTNLRKQTVDPKYVKVLNDTAIILRMPNLPSMKETFFCKVSKDNVTKSLAYNQVYVGTPPPNVIGFKCRSPNWTNMSCTFKKPYNTIDSEYVLKVSVNENLNPTCTSQLEVDNNRNYQTVLGFGAKQCLYRQSYAKLYFILNASNALGYNEERFTVNSFENVIPGQPQNLSTINVTSTSAVLVWSIPRELYVFQHPLVHSIKYTTGVFNGEWKEIKVIGEKSSYEVSLPDLKYAYTEFDVRVSSRVNASEDIPEMWSTNATHLFKTSARIPDRPPETNIGGFYVDDNNHVTIYWRGLKAYEVNGDNAGYNVEVVQGARRSLKPDLISTIMASYRSLSQNTETDLIFSVQSTNEKGFSVEKSNLTVPKKNKRCGPPEKIKKILTTENTNMRKYMLSWSPPLFKAFEIINYTVFWCNTKDESPNKCDMSIDFETVRNDQLTFTKESVEALNFAVSANSNHSSSGMVWALCTALLNNDINKLTAFHSTNVTDTSAIFKWNTQCVDMAMLDGYVISYCQITGDDPKRNCNDFQNITISSVNRTINEYLLTDLLPYSTYSVTIAGKSSKGIGPQSDPHRFTTFEAQPTPPRNLRKIGVTNTTATLEWDAPESINGVLNRYEIKFNRFTQVMEKTNNISIRYELTGLISNSFYSIEVVACSNVNCSMKSNQIHIRTDIGTPSNVTLFSYDRPTKAIEWSRPLIPGGYLEYFEVRIHKINEEPHTIQLNGTKCTPVLKCEYDQMWYDVRAVNVRYTQFRTNASVTKIVESNSKQICQEEDNSITQFIKDKDPHAILFQGNWTVVRIDSCGVRSIWKIVLFTVLGLLSVLMTAYMTFMLLTKFKKMKDIGVELPEGLRDIIQETKGGNLKLDCSFVPMDNNRSDGLFITRDQKHIMEQERTLLKKKQRFDATGGSPNSTTTNSQCEDNDGIDDSESEHINDDDSSANTITESIDFENAYPTPLLTVNLKPDTIKRDVQPNVYTASPVAIVAAAPPVSNLATDVLPMSPVNCAPVAMMSRPLNSNGYVTHDAAMNVTRPMNSGYMPWSAIGSAAQPKSTDSSPDEVKSKVPIVDTTDIQGYVTHKQLSHFGQLIQ